MGPLARVLTGSIERRWLVLLLTAGMAALGLWSSQRLPIDAVPDITNVQVQINTEAPGYSPLEVEQRVTFPIETAMAGLPRLESDPLAVALRPVAGHRRLQGRHRHLLRAPAGQRAAAGGEQRSAARARAGDGPDRHRPRRDLHVDGRGGAGRDASPTARRTPRWTCARSRTGSIRPQLRNVPGVTEVNTIGGFEKQFHVTPDPDALVAYGLTFRDVVRRARAQQRQRGRRLHRAQGRAVPGPRARPGGRPRARSAPSSIGTRGRHPDPRPRRRRRSRSAASCAPARRPRTARRSCWAPSSC